MLSELECKWSEFEDGTIPVGNWVHYFLVATMLTHIMNRVPTFIVLHLDIYTEEQGLHTHKVRAQAHASLSLDPLTLEDEDVAEEDQDVTVEEDLADELASLRDMDNGELRL